MEATMIRVLAGLRAMAQHAVDEHPDVPAHELGPDTIDQAAADILIQQGIQRVALVEVHSCYLWPGIAYYLWWTQQATHFFETYTTAPPIASVHFVDLLMGLLPDPVTP